jgi:biopolymer transport protein ExbD
MAFYASRRKLKPKEHDESGGELNIIPYLDIMMNLIMFMLLSITGFAVLGMVNVTSLSINGDVSDNQPKPDDKPPLLLTVAIDAKGFYVASRGTVVPGTNSEPGSPTVPKKGTEYDYAALTQKMIDIKRVLPSIGYGTFSQVIITADKTTEYGVVIKTMDATRETPNHELLFNDVSLGSF